MFQIVMIVLSFFFAPATALAQTPPGAPPPPGKTAPAPRDPDRDAAACERAKGDALLDACGRVIANPASKPEHVAMALMRRSGLQHDRRRYEAAIVDLDRLVALEPQNATAWSRRGHTRSEVNRNIEAIEDFNKALALDPGHVRARNGRGNAYRNLGEFDKSLTDYNEALARDPGYHWPKRNIGYTYERMGLFAEAEKSYRELTEGGPQPPNSENARAKEIAARDLERLMNVQKSRARIGSPVVGRAALIIANTAYKGGFEPLVTPARDARAIGAALRRLGFKDEDVVQKHDLNRRDMIAALREFEMKARTVDVAIVFFAGHGVRARSNLDYLIPIDASIVSERDLADEGVALERVVERIADAKRLQMVVFDACRSNELTRRLYNSTSAGELQRSGSSSAAPFEAPGLMLAFSARRGQAAGDGETHSPFVEALLANMEKPGVDLATVFSATAEHVRKATGEQQTPEIFGLSYGKGLVLK